MAGQSGAGEPIGAGEARVLALLDAVLAELRALAAEGEAARQSVAASAAGHAALGLEGVRAWLDEAARHGGKVAWPSAAAPLPPRPDPAPRLPGGPPPSGEADAALGERLVPVLCRAIDDLGELSEGLEDEDPVAQFDAVQAAGLAAAVLEAAHQRLLRADLARPRPVNLLGP